MSVPETTKYEVQATGIRDAFMIAVCCDSKEAAEKEAQGMVKEGAREIHVYLNGEFYSMWQRPADKRVS